MSLAYDSSDERASLSCSVEITGVDDLDARTLSDWFTLSDDCEQPNPFFSPWFLRPAMRWLDKEDAVRLLLIRDDQTGQLIGLIPIIAGKTFAKLPLKHVAVWKNNHLYTGTPLIRMGYALRAMRALVDWIGTGPFGIRFLRFNQLPADGPVYHALRAACASCEREMSVQARDNRAVLRRGHKFETLLGASQSAKQAAELRRRFRRFDEAGRVEFNETFLSTGDAPALSEAFMRLENAGWKKTDEHGFALAKTEEETQFFREAIRSGAERGAIVASVLTLDESPVAIGFSLRAQDMLFGFKTAFDRQHAKFSPGKRIFHETTERMLADTRYSLYDSCAKPDHPMIDRMWPDRQEITQISVPARGTHNANILRVAKQATAGKNRIGKTLVHVNDLIRSGHALVSSPSISQCPPESDHCSSRT